MSPKYFNTSGIADLDHKPAVTWVKAMKDQVIADAAIFDLATLGRLGAVAGWPGEEVAPSQPMHEQTQAVADAIRAHVDAIAGR